MNKSGVDSVPISRRFFRTEEGAAVVQLSADLGGRRSKLRASFATIESSSLSGSQIRAPRIAALASSATTEGGSFSGFASFAVNPSGPDACSVFSSASVASVMCRYPPSVS